MKAFLIAGGFFLIIFICLIPLKRNIQEYDVQKNGQLVKAVIIEVPNCFGTRVKHFIKFKFENEIYSKTTTGKPCESFKVGDSIALKHEPESDIFLYDTEDIKSQFISSALIAIAGISFIIIGFKKK